MNLVAASRAATATLALAASLGVAERIVDPFSRLDHDYMLEGPQGASEIFYVSSNWRDETGKHDDRTGDLLLLTSVLGATGCAVLGMANRQPSRPSPICLGTNPKS